MDLVPFRSHLCVCCSEGDQQDLEVFSGVVGMKDRVPWLRVLLQLWEGLWPFPFCHLSGEE